jgi:carbamoyl-phosphate synthase small subunit
MRTLAPARSTPATSATLHLDDGTSMRGRSFGAAKAVRGEVVFNTAMTGYIEALTDPSYCGQILVLTYPLVGNYGVPPPRRAGSLDGPYESGRIQVQALVVQNYIEAYSHYAARRSLHEWLAAEGIPAVTDVDTRSLTRRLRERGTMQGCYCPRPRTRRMPATARSDRHARRGVPTRRAAHAGPLWRRKKTILLVDAGARTTSCARSSRAAPRCFGRPGTPTWSSSPRKPTAS